MSQMGSRMSGLSRISRFSNIGTNVQLKQIIESPSKSKLAGVNNTFDARQAVSSIKKTIPGADKRQSPSPGPANNSSTMQEEKKLKTYASVGRIPAVQDLDDPDNLKLDGSPKIKPRTRDINEYGPQSPNVLDVKKQIKKSKISLKVTELDTKQADEEDMNEKFMLSQAEKMDRQNSLTNLQVGGIMSPYNKKKSFMDTRNQQNDNTLLKLGGMIEPKKTGKLLD